MLREYPIWHHYTVVSFQGSYCGRAQYFKQTYKKFSLYIPHSFIFSLYDQNVYFLTWAAENEELSM